jgi:uncharacterized protein (TIGR02145 family)
MGNLKIGNRQPSVGTIKQGSTDVSKIYKGDELLWPLGGEPDNYEPLSDNHARFAGMYGTNLITYFTNVQGPFNKDNPIPVDPQYVDETISCTGLDFRINSHISAISDNIEYVYVMNRTSSDATYFPYRGTKSGSVISFSGMSGIDYVDCISKDGQYVYAGDFVSGISDRKTLRISSDYGQTFSSSVNFNDPNNVNNWADNIACSMGGKYVYVATTFSDQTVRVYKSSDYGSSFSDISSIVGLEIGASTSLKFSPLVSGNGQYVYFYAEYFTTSNLPSGTIITMSDNFGTSFFQNSIDLRNSGYGNNQTDKYGKYLILSNRASNQYGLVSTNYSVTAQDPNLTEFDSGIFETSLSNFGTVGLMQSVLSASSVGRRQESATSVDSLDTFNYLGSNGFAQNYWGPLQKVVNIIPPQEVQIGNLIWTTANSVITESSEGTIPIAANASEMTNAYNNQLPMATYWFNDSSYSYLGLYYNPQAAAIVTPPSGFRMPTNADWNNLVNELENISGITNDITAGGGVCEECGDQIGNWNQDVYSNPVFGQSGFNAIETGWVRRPNSFGNPFWSPMDAYWWSAESISGSAASPVFQEVGAPGGDYIEYQTTASSDIYYYTIRFCKDA